MHEDNHGTIGNREERGPAMKNFLNVVAAMCIGVSAGAASAAPWHAASSPFRADTRTGTNAVLPEDGRSRATWDTAWEGASSVEVTLTRPGGSTDRLGGASSSRGTGRGRVEWIAGEREYGRFVLAHTSRGADGTVLGRLEAVFVRESPVATHQRVTFDANGGTCGTAEETYAVGEEYRALPTPQWSGHAWLGWFAEEDGGERVTEESVVPAVAERTLYARWTTTQTVLFDPTGGSCKKESVECPFGGTYSGFTTATWANHSFQGWYDDPEGGKRVKNGMAVTEEPERTLYAHWKEAVALSIKGFGKCMEAVAVARDVRSAGGQEFTLRFEVVADVVYEVQWASSPDGEWTVLERWIAEDDGEAEITIPVRPDAPAGFYRLAIADGE